MSPIVKGRQGFATMTPEAQRAIASKGGTAAQARGVGHQWTREDARAAGRKGGQVCQARKRAQRAAEPPT